MKMSYEKVQDPETNELEDDCCDLRDWLEEHIDNRHSEASWRRVWDRYINHPFVQHELAAAAEYIVNRELRLKSWKEDIIQDATLMLAQKLAHPHGLRFDRGRRSASFCGWLGRVVANDCRQAARRLRRHLVRAVELHPDVRAVTPHDKVVERHDLRRWLDQLPERDRKVFELEIEGYSVSEIGRLLNISRSCVYRTRQHGLRLFQLWAQEEDRDSFKDSRESASRDSA